MIDRPAPGRRAASGRVWAVWRRSLQAKLVLSFVFLSAVTVAIVGLLVYVRATDDLTRSVVDRLAAVAVVKADSLDRWVDEQRRSTVFLGFVPGFGDDARAMLDDALAGPERENAGARLARTMDVAVRQTSDAQELLILDLDGTIRISTRPEHVHVSQAEMPYFVNGSSHTTVQNAYVSPLTGTPTITISTPLFDEDGRGRRVGVLAANLNLERIDRIILDRTGLGTSGSTYLVGLDRRFLHGRLNAEVGLAVSSAGIDSALAGEDGDGLYADYRGTPVIGAYRWLGEHDVALLVELGQEEAFAPARQLAILIGVVGLFSAALLAVGIWLIARQVTRPILRLAETATRVQAGDLEATSGIRSEDEVGALATAFEAMTTQLRENVGTLERRVEERTLEIGRQKQYFEALVEVSPVAIATMDREERVTAWNPAATSLFGFAPEEAIGREISDLILRSDELKTQGENLARQALEHGRAHLISQRMRKDGSLLDAEIIMVPLVIDGDVLGYYAIYHDITALVAARHEADAANQAKSAFLAAMSHEIRTPMNAVIGMSGLMLDTRLDAEQREYADIIHTSGEALLTIINDILDFSKIEAGRFELDSHPFELAKTIEGAVAVLRPAAERKGLEVVLRLDEGLPGTVIGDAGRLRQIVLNLLSNAVKFTDAGEVRITVGGRSSTGDGGWDLDIAVSDSGVGIPPDRIDRLFQSFSQTDASIARRYGGTGLGLAISRRLAELMGGTITADSSGVPGEGSTFRLTARVGTAPSSGAADGTDAPTAGPPGSDGTFTFDPGLATRSPHRILLADDTPFNQKLAVRLLERFGYAVDVVDSGTAALKALAAPDGAGIDLLFMDVQMPQLDGLETTRRIRALWPGRDLRIVAMTANAMEGDREACLEAGMDDYLAKPIRPEALAAALEVRTRVTDASLEAT